MLSEKQIMDYIQATKTVSERKQFSYDEAKQRGDTLDVRRDTFDVQQFTVGLNVELQTRLENEALGGRIAGIETVDKMTDHQIAAEVRQRFLKET